MKFTIFKQAAFFLAALNMAFFSPALATMAQPQKTLEQELRPALKGKSLRTFGDFRKALAENLKPEQREKLEADYGSLDMNAIPRMQLIGNKLFVHGPSKLVTVEYLGRDKEFLKVNGIVFTKQDLSSAEEFHKQWSRSNHGQDRKQVSFIMTLFFPKAHAFLSGHKMGSVILGGVIGAVGGFLLFKMLNKKEKTDVKGYETGFNEGYEKGVEDTADYYNGSGAGSTLNTGGALGTGGSLGGSGGAVN